VEPEQVARHRGEASDKDTQKNRPLLANIESINSAKYQRERLGPHIQQPVQERDAQIQQENNGLEESQRKRLPQHNQVIPRRMLRRIDLRLILQPPLPRRLLTSSSSCTRYLLDWSPASRK